MNDRSLDIIPAQASDEDDIEQLLSECDLPADDITPAHFEHSLVMREGDRLVGTVGIEVLGQYGLLRSLAVPVSHRGCGLAKRLTTEAEVYAHACGVDTLYLLTMNTDGFFARLGYQRIERDPVPEAVRKTEQFRDICPSNAVCMVKRIKGTGAGG